MANDFIMTMSSDDEAPPQALSAGRTSKTKRAASAKLTRKEQLAQRKQSIKGKQSAKDKKRVEGSDAEEEDVVEEPKGSDEEGMQADFVFDGLGGGFVGDRRQQVWVSIRGSHVEIQS
jgi:hypothetical protein